MADTAVNNTEYSDKIIRVDDNGLYVNSIFSPSKGYHPMTQPDIIRVKIGGGTV